MSLDSEALLKRAHLTRFAHVWWAALSATGWRFAGTYAHRGPAGETPRFRTDAETQEISVRTSGIPSKDAATAKAQLTDAARAFNDAVRSVLLRDDRLRREALQVYVNAMIRDGVPGAHVVAVAYDCARHLVGLEGSARVMSADVAAICTSQTTPCTGLRAPLDTDREATDPGALGGFTEQVLQWVKLAEAGEFPAGTAEPPPGTLRRTAAEFAASLVSRDDGWVTPGRWLRAHLAAPRGGEHPAGRS